MSTAPASIPATVTSPGSTPTATPVPISGSRCSNGQLKVSLVGGDHAAGNTYTSIVFTNTSATPCTLAGHPGVSYVAGDDGHQVGSSASRDPGTIATVTLAASGVASALLHEANYEDYDPSDCKAVAIRGLRVYPPGSTAAVFLPRPGHACSSTGLPVGALSIGVVKAGLTE